MSQSNVIQLPRVEVSDFAKALLQLESERINLDNESARISGDQMLIMERAAKEVHALSEKQLDIINRRIAIDETIMKMLSARAVL